MAEVNSVITEVPKSETHTLESLEGLDKSQLIQTVLTLQERLEELTSNQDGGLELQSVKESEEKCKVQLAEVTRRETLLLKTLTEKEREVNDLASQIDELKQYQLPSNNQLRTMLLDPTINVVINRLKKEFDSTKLRLEESQSELSAWKFTQDSQTGKQLMARCRTLFKENEELGKQISQGRTAKLEGEIALEKKLVEEMKVAQNETEQFVMELDEDTEGLQATVYLLQQQLKEAKENLSSLEGREASTDITGGSNTPTTAEIPQSTLDSNPDYIVTTIAATTNTAEMNNMEQDLENSAPGSENVQMSPPPELTSEEEFVDKKVTPPVTNGHTEMIVN